MPHTDIQWLWFLFFGLGAIGGIMFLLYLVMNAVDTLMDWLVRQ